MRKVLLSDLEVLPISGLQFSALEPLFSDEEYIGDKIEKNPKMTIFETMTHFLSRLVTRLGSVEFELDDQGRPLKKESPRAFKALLDLPKRDVETLYLWIQYQMDPIYKFELTCGDDGCGEKSTVLFPLGSLNIDVLEEEDTPHIDVEMRSGIRLGSELFFSASVGFLSWKDVYRQTGVVSLRRSTIKNMIKQLDGSERVLTDTMLSRITSVDRKRLMQAFLELKGGAEWKFKAPCVHCSEETEWEYDYMENTDFF